MQTHRQQPRARAGFGGTENKLELPRRCGEVRTAWQRVSGEHHEMKKGRRGRAPPPSPAVAVQAEAACFLWIGFGWHRACSLTGNEMRMQISRAGKDLPPASSTPAKSCRPHKHSALGGVRTDQGHINTSKMQRISSSYSWENMPVHPAQAAAWFKRKNKGAKRKVASPRLHFHPFIRFFHSVIHSFIQQLLWATP